MVVFTVKSEVLQCLNTGDVGVLSLRLQISQNLTTPVVWAQRVITIVNLFFRLPDLDEIGLSPKNNFLRIVLFAKKPTDLILPEHLFFLCECENC